MKLTCAVEHIAQQDIDSKIKQKTASWTSVIAFILRPSQCPCLTSPVICKCRTYSAYNGFHLGSHDGPLTN